MKAGSAYYCVTWYLYLRSGGDTFVVHAFVREPETPLAADFDAYLDRYRRA